MLYNPVSKVFLINLFYFTSRTFLFSCLIHFFSQTSSRYYRTNFGIAPPLSSGVRLRNPQSSGTSSPSSSQSSSTFSFGSSSSGRPRRLLVESDSEEDTQPSADVTTPLYTPANPAPRTTVSSKRNNTALRDSIYKDMTKGCCQRNCIDQLSPSQVIEERVMKQGMSQSEFNTFICNCIRTATCSDRRTGTEWCFILHNKRLCRTAFERIYDISNNLFYSSVKRVRLADGAAVHTVHGNVGSTSHVRAITSDMHSWIQSFFNTNAKPTPMKEVKISCYGS